MSDPIGDNAKEQLRSMIERIETLETQKAEVASDIKDVYTEAAGNGFDKKALRTIVRMRKQDAGDREAEAAILDTYLVALGMA